MKLSDLSSLILLVLVLLIPAAVEAQNGQKVRGDVRAPDVSPCPMQPSRCQARRRPSRFLRKPMKKVYLSFRMSLRETTCCA